VHFLLEVTGLREKSVSVSGYGALFFVFAYSIAGMLYFYLYSLIGTKFSISYILFLSLTGALSASLMEYVKADKSIIILASSTTYLVFTIYAIQTTILYLSEAFVIIFTDIRYFIVLLSFYVFGSAATKYMYEAKYKTGIAEPAGGARGFVNVFSNSLPVASIATALGDTMASEIGKTSERAYLITNFRRVKPGTNGGVSLKGEFAAAAGCLIISVLAWILRIVPLYSVLPVFVAAFPCRRFTLLNHLSF